MTRGQFLLWFEEVVRPTEPMFRLVPPDQLQWKPTATSFSVGQLMEHLIRAVEFNSIVLRREVPPLRSMREILVANRRHPSAVSVDEAVARWRSASTLFTDACKQVDDHTFLESMIETPQKGTIHVWRFCLFVGEHHIHHLMELHLDLKLLGVRVNTATLYV